MSDQAQLQRVLETREWWAIFRDYEVHRQGIPLEKVQRVLHVAQPNHEPIEGFCDQLCDGQRLCTNGYLGLFEIRHRQYLGVRANCDPSAKHGFVECKVGRDPDLIIEKFFTEEERARLEIPISGDRIYQNT